MTATTYASLAPAMTEALTARLKVVFASLPVKIHDGSFLSKSTAKQAIIVGFSGIPSALPFARTSFGEQGGTDDVTVTGEPMGLGGSVLQTIVINMASLVRSGSTDEAALQAARDTAHANYQLVASNVQPPALGSKIARVIVGETEQTNMIPDRQGTLALVQFTITGKGFAGR